jgi:NADPH:quinone reductase-like Zn-dependent oxidoreductase/3-oxoacyl-(acyl-carrier-protein) synthase
MAVGPQCARLAGLPLCALEAALALVQAQASTASMPDVRLLMVGKCAYAGAWGIGRSARAEVSLPLKSIRAPLTMALACGIPPNEPEAVLHEGSMPCVPRLRTAPLSFDGLVRLHLHTRGAIGNLFLEPQRALPPLSDAEVLLHVRAVGLNFRDVLNVLGEYPGDPGPPGGDAAGVVDERPSPLRSAFGLGYAPLACVAVAAAPFLANKPSALSFEQASTLPVTWATTHAAVERAGLHAGCAIVVHAAAGGVGLKAIEYVRWLRAAPVGTAGRPHKHAQLREAGALALCGSRDGVGFAMGAARLLNATRAHAVLNSLSLDFIAASFAALSEGGVFAEIGKRGIWALERHLASAPSTVYCAIALDVDMALEPEWMHGVLRLLAARAGAGAATSLPLQSFDMEAHHELAFRTLQNGLNTGKVVVRIAARTWGCNGTHVVTGGTSGLGLLTGRWLAQRGASRLVLASRSGSLVNSTDPEWAAVQASSVSASLERCDTGEAASVKALIAGGRASLCGVWHAAGVLADAVLTKQDAFGLARVHAPKAHGTWSLHAAVATSALDAVALFSSVAALLGGAGQANYSAANACLDALAVSRRAYGVASASVQWGAWAEVGMAARGAASERMAAMEAMSGVGRIGLALGLGALGAAVKYGSPSVLCMVPVSWSRFLSQGAKVPALLAAFAPAEIEAGDMSLGTTTATCVISLEVVLELVKRTAGGSVDADAPLMEAGVDSLGAVELRNQLQSAAGGQPLPSTLVFDHPTARQLASVLQPKEPASAAVASMPIASLSAGTSVAINGLSALLPLGASSLCMAFFMAACGRDAIAQVPATRWDAQTQPALSEPIASRVRHMGFVRGAELVDNVAFAVSPAEAAAMDPCQRLVLEFGYVALHRAHLDRATLSGSLTGVFLGFAGTEFAQILGASPAGGSVYAATGSSVSIAAGRLSYTLGLHGPCVTYDTACSAALAACHAGLRAMQLAECKAGLVMGVTLVLALGVGMSFAVAGMTSARGRSHTFDDRADGYVRGEACGGVALGRGDGVLEVLGSAVRQDGRSASLTAPSGLAQQGLLVAALHDAGTSIDALALAEAHGTGTALGDPIEAGSLVAAVLSARREALPVGGVKATIGHAEPAAGMTGLLKLALHLDREEAAPNAQLRSLNPHVGSALRDVACTLPVQRALTASDSGGVSSFGYSGTIAHAVIAVGRGGEQRGVGGVPDSSTALALGPSGAKRAGAGLGPAGGGLQARTSQADVPRSPVASRPAPSLLYRRHAFRWRDQPHPFAQRSLPSSAGDSVVFQSPTAGALHALVADHVVQGRVVFPGAGYLEMARAAGARALCAVYFLQPLAIEAHGVLVECVVSKGRFEVCSREAGAVDAVTVHCSGATSGATAWGRIEHASLRAPSIAADVGALYDGFDAVGLQYGPGYRTLVHAWGGASHALARLRTRSAREGTQVHPADLDDALCTSGVLASSGAGGETLLPFAVDDALLRGATGELWAVRAAGATESALCLCAPLLR